MKILITGGAGFIGSAVARLAISGGHTVVIVDALTYASCLKSLSSIQNKPNYFFEKANICNRKKLDDIFEQYKPDAVMHLAAESHVDRSIQDPEIFIKTNIKGTFNLLEATKNYWSKQGSPSTFRFHHISTDEVFGTLENDSEYKFTEETAYKPRSPYSASKASSDHLVNAWHETFGLPILITNCSNNYGPFQFPEKLIPVLILNALSETNLPIYGDGRNMREWLYVNDHAEALMLVLERGIVGRCYNIGSKNECTNIDLAKLVCKILNELKPRKSGKYEELITFVDDRLGHDKRYAIDSSRIENELGWRPKIDLNTGLKETVQWYIDNKNLLKHGVLRSKKR